MTKSYSGKWAFLLEDADVNRWYNDHRRRSRITANTYLGCLGRGLKAVDLDPKTLLELDQQGRDDAVSDIINHYEAPTGAKALAPESVHNYVKAVVSWLRWNGKPPMRKHTVSNLGWNPVAEGYAIPSQEAVSRFFHVAGMRARVAGALIAFTGMRPEVLGWEDASQGLQLKHLVELQIGEVIQAEATPLRIDVPRHLSKSRRAYVTFLGAQGTAYLTAYLEARRRQGELLTPDSPVLTDSQQPGRFITTTSVSSLIRRALNAAGIREPPYILKSVWMNRAIRAEADGFTTTMRTFCVGHAGTLATRYGLRKQLDPESIEQIRSGYVKALRHMETEAAATTEDPVREFWAMVLDDLSDEEVPRESLSGKSDEEIRELVTKQFQEARQAAPTATRQEVIPLTDVGSRLGLGWRFVANLGDGTAIVEGT